MWCIVWSISLACYVWTSRIFIHGYKISRSNKCVISPQPTRTSLLIISGQFWHITPNSNKPKWHIWNKSKWINYKLEDGLGCSQHLRWGRLMKVLIAIVEHKKSYLFLFKATPKLGSKTSNESSFIIPISLYNEKVNEHFSNIACNSTITSNKQRQEHNNLAIIRKA